MLLCCESLQPHQAFPWAGTQELGWGGEVGKGTGRASCFKDIISFSTTVTLCAFSPILKMWKPRLRRCVRQFGPGPPAGMFSLRRHLSCYTHHMGSVESLGQKAEPPGLFYKLHCVSTQQLPNSNLLAKKQCQNFSAWLRNSLRLTLCKTETHYEMPLAKPMWPRFVPSSREEAVGGAGTCLQGTLSQAIVRPLARDP